MAQAFKPTLTNAGKALLNSVSSGGILTITRASLGDGQLLAADPIEPLTDLLNPKQAAQLKYGETPTDGRTVIAVQYDNKDLDNAFAINELGIFAKANSGPEVLYCYMTFGDKPEIVQPAHIGRFIRSFDIPVQTDNLLSVSVEIAPAALATAQDIQKILDGTSSAGKAKTAEDAKKLGGNLPAFYAKATDLQTHVTDQNNPHRVTAGQLGAATAESVAAHVQDIANPHGVSASQIGALPSGGTAANASALGGKAPSHYATAAATQAAQNTANAAMPKSGGSFSGRVVASHANINDWAVRNIYFTDVNGNGVSSCRLRTYRK